MSLTARQRELLVFITEYQAKSDGVSPSFDEMKQAMGLVSKSGIHRLVRGLEERAFIACLPNRKRCVTVLKTPDGLDILGVNPVPGSSYNRDFQKLSQAITRLYVAGILSDGERNKARKQLLRLAP